MSNSCLNVCHKVSSVAKTRDKKCLYGQFETAALKTRRLEANFNLNVFGDSE